MAEIEEAVAVVRNAKAPFAVLQCTTQYPSPPETIGLNILDEFRRRFGGAVGLSDHSGTIYPALAASAAHRVEIIEVHLTMSREMFGPDVRASVTPPELAMICDGVRFIERMRAAPVDKTEIDASIGAMRAIFFKSIVAARDLPAGTVLGREHFEFKKPGNGIPAAQIDSLLGKTLRRDISRDAPLKLEDIQPS
jgi:N-acetylneuraminate synthase